MSELVAVSSPASGREMVERYRSARTTFFPRRPVARPRIPPPEPIVPTIVYAFPIEIARPARLDLIEEARQIAALAGKRVRVLEITRACAEHFNIHLRDLLSHRRSRWIVRPRQIVMYLSKEMTTRSLPEIGRLMHGRDHTTVLHGYRKIASLIEAGDPIAADVEAIRARLLA